MARKTASKTVANETMERFAEIRAELEQVQEDSKAKLTSILQELDSCIEVLGAHAVTIELTPILAKLGFSLKYTGIAADEIANAITEIIHRAEVAQGEPRHAKFGQRIKRRIASKLGVKVEDVDATLKERFDLHVPVPGRGRVPAYRTRAPVAHP
jgi:hypothetical protein